MNMRSQNELAVSAEMSKVHAHFQEVVVRTLANFIPCFVHHHSVAFGVARPIGRPLRRETTSKGVI